MIPGEEGAAFAPLFADARADARAWLATELARSSIEVVPEVLAALANSLVLRLAACVARVVPHEHARTGGTLAGLIATLATPTGWQQLARTYPAMRALVDRCAAAWRARTAAFLTCAARDAPGGRPVEVISLIDFADRLQARRATLAVGFGDGSTWVYRPRPMAIAAWFMDVCARLNASGLSAPLHVRRIAVMPDCTWDEFVPVAGATEPAAITRYVRRAGMLVRLAERVAAIDLHVHNLLAAGEHPVLVDLETLFAPEPATLSPAELALLRSPLRSSLLLAYVFGDPGRRAIQVGGLNRGGTFELPFARDGDADDGLEHARATIPTSLAAHIEVLLDGYDELDDALGRIALDDLLARVPTMEVRHLRDGGALIHRRLWASLAPALLRAEPARDAWLAELPLASDERAALRDLEVPRSYAPVGAHPALAHEAPFTAAQRRRRHDLIRSAVGLAEPDARWVHVPRPAMASPSPTAAALAIADGIIEQRFPGPDWHAATWVPDAGVRNLGLISADLLSGLSGLALLFASCARVSGAPRYHELALATIARVRGLEHRPGAFVGAGGLVYALARCAALIGEPALGERATRLVRMYPRRWLDEGPWDVVSGVAGFVLGAQHAGGAPSEVVAALREAVAREVVVDHHLDGGVPSEVPDAQLGAIVALARAGVAMPVPSTGSLAWRLELAPVLVGEAQRAIAAPHAALLDRLDLALAAYRATRAPAMLAAARAVGEELRARHRDTGRWLDGDLAPRHDLSALSGLGAVALGLLALDAPDDVAWPRQVR